MCAGNNWELFQRLRGCDPLWGYPMNLAKLVFLCVLWVLPVLSVLCFLWILLSLLSLIYVLIPDRSMAWRYDLRVGKAFLVLRHRARCVIIQISCCCALQCFPYCVALHININIALATEGKFHGSTSACGRSGLRVFTRPTNWNPIW